jgi:hypothetical protein
MNSVRLLFAVERSESGQVSRSCGAIAEINAKSRLSDEKVVHLFNCQRLYYSTHGIMHLVLVATGAGTHQCL